MTNAGSVLDLQIREGIAYLTFDRPEARNSINLQFGKEFLRIATSLASASEVRAIVLTGRGQHFCFGGDLKGMVAAGSDVQGYLRELTSDLHAGMLKLARGHAPVIAAVNGTAAGAGLGLVLLADLAIAARSAQFVSAYTAVGLTPDAGCSYFLSRAIGRKRAMELFLTNRVLNSQEALEWGVINQVVDDERLLAGAAEIAHRLAAVPPNTYAALKRLVAETEPGLEAQLERESLSIAARGSSSESREAIAAFLEKRAPCF
jgi:2-(1,2-epoxy-1,2-dihydrophenyl)acetyl-CoA isomerase